MLWSKIHIADIATSEYKYTNTCIQNIVKLLTGILAELLHNAAAVAVSTQTMLIAALTIFRAAHNPQFRDAGRNMLTWATWAIMYRQACRGTRLQSNVNMWNSCIVAKIWSDACPSSTS